MRLLVVRHAIAEDREAFARSHKDDAARPLTPDGRRKMARAAAGLKQLVPELDLLAASPYKRALETAEIIAHAYGPPLCRSRRGIRAGTPRPRGLERTVPRAPQGRGVPARIPRRDRQRGGDARLVPRSQTSPPARRR